jgi:hypothetical protein
MASSLTQGIDYRQTRAWLTRSNIWNDNITKGQIQHLEIPNYRDKGVMVSPRMCQRAEMRKPNDPGNGRPLTGEPSFTFPRSTGAVASSLLPTLRRRRLGWRYTDLQTSYQRALSPQDYGFSPPGHRCQLQKSPRRTKSFSFSSLSQASLFSANWQQRSQAAHTDRLHIRRYSIDGSLFGNTHPSR